MKRFLIAALAVCMALSLAACSGDSTGKAYDDDNIFIDNKTVDFEAINPAQAGKIIAYDAPAGYYIFGSSDQSTAFVQPNIEEGADGEYTHVIETYFEIADPTMREALLTKKRDVLEDRLYAEFPDYLTVDFVSAYGWHGIRIIDTESGEFEEVTYYLIVGEWYFMVHGESPAGTDIDEVHENIKTLISTLRLEEMTFE